MLGWGWVQPRGKNHQIKLYYRRVTYSIPWALCVFYSGFAPTLEHRFWGGGVMAAC